ncbi:protein FAM166C-like [Hylaeus anthracinus]|uniref:protein FAM166C-like n=1 Tax=Hylaeus anthracinus TaxID=313031 RepID=UPI0023B89AB3|nr:protein FAM166C-like [Hylaeus anthracinus]
MVVGNSNSSKSQPTFYPPSLMPSYMGPHPPSKFDRSLEDGGATNYFQNYRNRVLSKISMPIYKWGMESVPYSPRPNIAATKIHRSLNRNLTVPLNDISRIDAARMKEIDNLYKGVQLHRKQYMDHTGSLHPLEFFKPDHYKYQCAPGMTLSYFSKYPTSFVAYKIPNALPLTYERRKQTPYIPDMSLSGIYNQSSCNAYRR